MTDDPEIGKLDELTARIRQAEKKPSDATAANTAAPMKMSRIGFDFVATILASLFLGWIADRELGTGPWGIVIMMFLGFAVGMMRVWQSQQSE